jgi:hypothetical protein
MSGIFSLAKLKMIFVCAPKTMCCFNTEVQYLGVTAGIELAT